MSSQPKYAFSPSLLDAYQRMIDTEAEDYFYKDEAGNWHKNWNDADETLHFSEGEVAELLKKEFIDTINKVPQEPSEAADKGTAFNEIVDCLVKNCRPTNPNIIIKTIRSGKDLFNARQRKAQVEAGNGDGFIPVIPEHDLPSCQALFDKIGETFIYTAIDGFEFFYDLHFCLDAGKYFKNSICQYYTKANIETSLGLVELHGYIDYLHENIVRDCKTTKSYQFGNYQKKWQRYTYPFTLIESGMMKEVLEFEFTVYQLSGGSSKNPLITGTQFRETYTYEHDKARSMLTNQCERLISFIEDNRDLIINKKIFCE